MKKKRIIILIICFILIGFSITINYETINYAKERIIITNKEKQENEPSEEIETSLEEPVFEETMPEEGQVAGVNAKEEEDTSNSYTLTELSILLLSTIVLINILIYLITTKLGSINLKDQLNTKKKLIYYCIILVLLCSTIPPSIVIATDKKVLNGYDTKDSSEKSLAIIEIDQDKKDSNIKEESTIENTSVIQVSNTATYTGDNLTLNKNDGKTTDNEGSLLYGLNSTFLAKEGSIVTLNNSKLTSNVSYSSAFFATENGTQSIIENSTLNTKGDYSNALVSSESAEITADNIEITTTGNNSSAIKTIGSNSLITVNNSALKTEGENSSLLYSNGKIEITKTKGETCSNIAIIEDRNSISIEESNLTITDSKKANIESLFYLYSEQSQSSSNLYTNAKLDIIDSTISILKDSSWYQNASVFYLTNTKANINITNTKINFSGKTLLNATSNSEYGDSESNGADVTLTATNQELEGQIISDEISKVRLNLNESEYEGQINTNNKLTNVDITFDYDSKWYLTGDSYINTLTITKTDYLKKNVRKYIKSNGYNVYYNSASNEWLEGKTYNLNGGGKLIPIES